MSEFWVSVLKDWTIPSIIVNGVVIPIEVSTQTKDKLTECNRNSKYVHAIFMAIPFEKFKRRSMFLRKLGTF